MYGMVITVHSDLYPYQWYHSAYLFWVYFVVTSALYLLYL